MKIRRHQHVVYACTDEHIEYSVVTKNPFHNRASKCGVAKSCPGTHTTPQASMTVPASVTVCVQAGTAVLEVGSYQSMNI